MVFVCSTFPSRWISNKGSFCFPTHSFVISFPLGPLRIMINLLVLSLTLFLCLSNVVHGVGMTIPPILINDKKKYSGLNHLYNCVSYPTVKDDIILVHINSGDKIAAQSLNLNIFDSDSNTLRIKNDLSQTLDLMFTNLNNPAKINDDLSKKSNILNRLHLGYQNQPESDISTDLFNSNKGRSFIHICFDNLYGDKSWNFRPSSRDIEISVEIKNMTTIKQTNYNKYAKYFQSKQEKENSNFNEGDFDSKISSVEQELNDVVENLKNSANILSNLMDLEFKLRDVNESIFARYTKLSIILLTCIGIFGIGQVLYFKCLMRKTKVL